MDNGMSARLEGRIIGFDLETIPDLTLIDRFDCLEGFVPPRLIVPDVREDEDKHEQFIESLLPEFVSTGKPDARLNKDGMNKYLTDQLDWEQECAAIRQDPAERIRAVAEEMDVRRRAVLAKWALDPNLCRICASGFAEPGESRKFSNRSFYLDPKFAGFLVSDEAEQMVLNQTIGELFPDPDRNPTIITYNGVRFDFRVLLARLIHHGYPTQVIRRVEQYLNVRPYKIPGEEDLHIDLYNHPLGGSKLEILAPRWTNQRKPDHSARVWELMELGQGLAVAKGAATDAWRTVQIAQEWRTIPS